MLRMLRILQHRTLSLKAIEETLTWCWSLQIPKPQKLIEQKEISMLKRCLSRKSLLIESKMVWRDGKMELRRYTEKVKRRWEWE